MIPPWATLACDVCGCEHLATRANASDADSSTCEGCETHMAGYAEGFEHVLVIIRTRLALARSVEDADSVRELERLVADLRTVEPVAVARILGEVPRG